MSTSPSRTQRASHRPIRWTLDTVSHADRAVVTTTGRLRSSHAIPWRVRDARAGARILRAFRAFVREPRGRSTLAVRQGSGIFSRMRLGVVLVNAMGWGTGTPITVGGRVVRMVQPTYRAPPSTTPPRQSSAPFHKSSQ